MQKNIYLWFLQPRLLHCKWLHKRAWIKQTQISSWNVFSLTDWKQNETSADSSWFASWRQPADVLHFIRLHQYAAMAIWNRPRHLYRHLNPYWPSCEFPKSPLNAAFGLRRILLNVCKRHQNVYEFWMIRKTGAFRWTERAPPFSKRHDHPKWVYCYW